MIVGYWYVNCRIGSLENAVSMAGVAPVVNCRIGSLENTEYSSVYTPIR